MKFKLDENVPRRAAEVFRAAGHDALLLLDQVPAGVPDEQVAELVAAEGRVLVTLDLDFADIRAYEPSAYPGIIVLRPGRGDAPSVAEMIERVLKTLDREPLPGYLWIVEQDRIRIRGGSG